MTKINLTIFSSIFLTVALLLSPFILLAQSPVNQQEINNITEQIKSLTAKALTLEQNMQSAPTGKKKEMAKESKKLNKEINTLQKKLKKLQAVKQVPQPPRDKPQAPPPGNQLQPPQAVEQPIPPSDSLKMIEEISFMKAEIAKRSEEIKLLETMLPAIEGPDKAATEKRIAAIKEKITMMEKFVKEMEKKPVE